MVRWGIMELGNIAQKFAQTVNAMENGTAVLTAVASRNADKAKAFAEKYGADRYFDSYEKLCLCDDVDAIYICTPNNMHYENCLMALSHGKHVLCEKPFMTDAAQADEVYGYAEEKGLFAMEGLWICHLPLIKKAAEVIKSGAVGDVSLIRADYGFIAEGARRERKFKSELGGGALLDVGIYNIGFARLMYGTDPVDIKTSCAFNEYGTDMLGNILAEYPDKKFASLTSSIGLKTETEGVVYGTKGRIYFPNYQKAENMKIIYNDGREESYSLPFAHTGFEYEIEECARCIAEGRTQSNVYTHSDSIAVIKTLDRVRQAWGMKFSFEK